MKAAAGKGATTPSSNEPRISPEARHRQSRVYLASPRDLVLRWHHGDFTDIRLKIGRHKPAAQAFVDALPLLLYGRFIGLLCHVHPHTTDKSREDGNRGAGSASVASMLLLQAYLPHSSSRHRSGFASRKAAVFILRHPRHGPDP
jgi:hypothetical protein